LCDRLFSSLLALAHASYLQYATPGDRIGARAGTGHAFHMLESKRQDGPVNNMVGAV